MLGAAYAAPAERVIPRTIIALYDSAEGPWVDTFIHRMAEKPLNHLGLIVEPHDIHEPLPDLRGRADVRGILTWWQGESVPDPVEYLTWAGNAISTGMRFVILEETGVQSGSQGPSSADNMLADFLRQLGLRHREQSYDLSFTARAVVKDPGMVEYERRLPVGMPLYDAMQRIDNSTRSYLSVEQPGSSVLADLVITGPRGSYVAPDYTHHLVPENGFRQWYLNPFAFFREAFATDDLPKPDITTIAGRRIYYSHIDGDGWRSITEVQPYHSRKDRAIDVLIDTVFKAFPNLPVTLAPVAGDLDPAWCGDAPAQDAARRAFALPNVEPATHTYSHPFTWNTYAFGQPEGEPVGEGHCFGKPASTDARATDASKHAHSDGQDRAYLTLPFDMEREAEGSARYIESFLPPGKCVTLLQWSGDTTPFPEMLRNLERKGIKNINGGDARFDTKFPSVAWVSPVGRVTPGGLQVYASASNENTYTTNWTDHFYGFRDLPQNLERTEAPLRLLPINVYYHVYSGEKLASLNALLFSLRYAEQQEIAPITTTAYVDIARGFYTAQFVEIAPRTWRVVRRGALQTLRFDVAPVTGVDLSRSSGILGWRQHGNSLYVALDPVVPEPVVTLADKQGNMPASTYPNRPTLVQSRWLIQDLRIITDRFGFSATGFGPGEMVWAVPKPGWYEVAATKGGEAQRQEVERRSDGTLAFRIPATGPDHASIRITWLDKAPEGTSKPQAYQEPFADAPVPALLGYEEEQCRG
jgi:hypothetical protein